MNKNKQKQQEELKLRRNQRINKGLSAEELDHIKFNKFMHGPLYLAIKIMRIINGYKLDIKGDIPKNIERPIIVAPNHVRKQDIEIIMESIPIHMFLLSGDFENVHGTLSGGMLEKNGIVYLDMEDKKDRFNIKRVIRDILNNNINLLWFYEASWNLSPNKPYYDGYNYIVQAAIDSNALILPISFDMIDNKAYINIGDVIDYRSLYGYKQLSKEEKVKALDLLKGQIGKGLFEIWEKYSFEKRENIVDDYWEKYKKQALSEWFFTEEDIERKHFVDKNIIEQDEVFSHLNNLEVNKSNAFLFSKKNHY